MADKTLKSLNFGGADNYFPLPIVSTNDNDNILVVADGEWVAKSPNDITGQYVWSKKDSADGPVTGYVISNDGEKYPDGGWSEGVFYTLELEPTLPYLSFIGNEDFTLKTYRATKNWDGTLEYSTDKSIWNTWDGTTTISSSGSKLYLRGTGNTKITGDSLNYRFVFTGTSALKIACKGNIENLLDYETVSAGGHPTMANYCYQYMFLDCTSLTTAPALPATTLAGGCYANMFYGCTSLTTAPALPATTLADDCYEYMFYGCTSLTAAPALPATTVAGSCYDSMFYGCTALTTAPALPATTLANLCYYNMFYGCTALTPAPALPANTLAMSCYEYMFYGCTALTETPELHATTLANYCYTNMFYGCKALTTAPALPATTLADHCYEYMFGGCTSLTTAPQLPATTLDSGCYFGMFQNCAKIKLSTTKTGEYQTAYRIPKSGTGTTTTDALSYMFNNTGGTFTGTPSINTTYYLSTSNTVV